MTEEFCSMKNGELQFIAADFEPIPHTEKIRTPSHIWGRELKREAISLWARFHERFGIDVQCIGVDPKEDIYEIHKESSPGKKYLHQQLKDNAFAHALNKYAALFQKELRKQQTPNTAITGTVTVPDDCHAVHINDNFTEIKTDF